jgi:hypothetical protein
VRVHENERKFLERDTAALQSLTLLRHAGGWPAIELLPGRPARADEVPPARLLVPMGAEVRAGAGPGVEAGPTGLETPRLLVPPGVAPLLRALGFTETAGGALHLRRPLPSMQLTAQLEAGETRPMARPTHLDAPGPVVVGLLSTALAADADAVTGVCVDRTDPFEVEVGGRSLRLVLLRAPAGPLIELVQAA